MLNAGLMTKPADLKQFAPTGKLRGGVVAAPAASAFFAIREDKGEVTGVTVDLIRSFAAALKLPLTLQICDNSGQVTDAVASGDCDVAFMPQDAERAKRVDFGPAYYFIESTYLVRCRQARPSKPSMKSIARDVALSLSPTRQRPEVHGGPPHTPTSRKCLASIG